jgi:ribonuclease HI
LEIINVRENGVAIASDPLPREGTGITMQQAYSTKYQCVIPIVKPPQAPALLCAKEEDTHNQTSILPEVNFPEEENDMMPNITIETNTHNLTTKTSTVPLQQKEQASSVTHNNSHTSKRVLNIYTDGSCIGNGTMTAKGGLGVYFDSQEYRKESFCHSYTRILQSGPGTVNESTLFPSVNGTLPATSSRMELLAIVMALKWCQSREQEIKNKYNVIIYTDSQYAYNCFAKQWIEKWKRNGWYKSKTGKVLNRDIIEEMDRLFGQLKSWVKFKKVTGHAGVHGNVRADALANEASAIDGTVSH